MPKNKNLKNKNFENEDLKNKKSDIKNFFEN